MFRNRANGTAEIPSRTAASRIVACTRSARSELERPANLERRCTGDFDESGSGHLLQERDDILLTGLSTDVIFGHDRVTNRIHRRWVLDETPNARAERIKTVVGA